MQSVFCSVPYSEFIQNMKCVFDKQIWPFELFKNVMLIFLEQENTDISSTCRRHFFFLLILASIFRLSFSVI